MTPSARLQAAIDLLGELERSNQPADRFMREFFRARRYAGSKDRAAVGERVYAILRHRASLAWRMGEQTPRALVIASLLGENGAEEIAALFTGDGYGPSALSDGERAAIAAPPAVAPPPHVAGEYPKFLEEELLRAFGTDLPDEMLAMQSRAPIDLRVNTLKSAREAVLEALRAEGFDAEPTRFSSIGIRIPSGEGLAKLGKTAAFLSGAFEFQDEAAQLAALLCAAAPGMRVLDYAAGAGGKSLALAATMNNTGEIVAHDVRPARLAPLLPRAERAGATIIHASADAPSGVFDLVLIDAPCSGTGTWRRQPELRWRISQPRLSELMALQDQLLAEGASFVLPGGRLVYATCSLLPCENDDRVAQFLSRHADFSIIPAAEVWRDIAATDSPQGMGEFFKATPRSAGMDGFFTAIFQRAPAA